MAKIAYWDCPTGIAGDMCLGALVHVGVPLTYLADRLQGLGIATEYRLATESVHRRGQVATKMHVHLTTIQTRPRHLPEIEAMIQGAKLPPRATSQSLAVFRTLAAAEAAVHGVSPHQVHFHEVGATDALVDIVGTCLGLDWLEIDQVYCSALPTGSGTVAAAHGPLPVPTPAVLALWQSRQVPVYNSGLAGELVTPTGAALMVALAAGFGGPPAMTLQGLGLGAGSKDLPLANVVRLWVGTADPASLTREQVLVLETQLDDLSPQGVGYVCEALRQTGALEVFTQAIGMKKNRPGVLITVITTLERGEACEGVLFRETTTLGVRRQIQERRVLEREIQVVTTPWGPVQVKVAQGLGRAHPEYEDCARLAREHHVPWLQVHQAALLAWQQP